MSADMSPYCSAHDVWLIMKLCLYVGYHDANNVSNFGGDPVTQLNLKNVKINFYAVLQARCTIAMTRTLVLRLLLRDHAQAAGVWKTVAGHTSLSTALVVPVYWSSLERHIVGREHVLAFPRSKSLDWNHTRDMLVNS